MKKITISIAMAIGFALSIANPALAANPLFKAKKDVRITASPNSPLREPLNQICFVGKDSVVEQIDRLGSDELYVKLVHHVPAPSWRTLGCRFLIREGVVRKVDFTRHPSAPNATWFITKEHTEIKSEPSRLGAGPWQPRGQHKCTIPRGEHVHRDNSDRIGEPDWIYVRWKKKWNHNFEWNYHGHWGPEINNWCPDWSRHGWVWVGKLKAIGNSPRW